MELEMMFLLLLLQTGSVPKKDNTTHLQSRSPNCPWRTPKHLTGGAARQQAGGVEFEIVFLLLVSQNGAGPTTTTTNPEQIPKLSVEVTDA